MKGNEREREREKNTFRMTCAGVLTFSWKTDKTIIVIATLIEFVPAQVFFVLLI